MIKTDCDIHGIKYSLKYKRTRSEEGELYKGILFLKDAFGFSYLIKNDKTTLFDPSFTDPNRKNAIIKAIEEYNRKNFK